MTDVAKKTDTVTLTVGRLKQEQKVTIDALEGLEQE